MSGGIAGFTQCVATNPMEVTKMFYQARGSKRTAIPLADVFADVEHQASKHACSFHQRCREKSLGRRRRHVRHANPTVSFCNILRMYRGVCSTLLRDIPFSMMFFSMHGVIQVRAAPLA